MPYWIETRNGIQRLGSNWEEVEAHYHGELTLHQVEELLLDGHIWSSEGEDPNGSN